MLPASLFEANDACYRPGEPLHQARYFVDAAGNVSEGRSAQQPGDSEQKRGGMMEAAADQEGISMPSFLYFSSSRYTVDRVTPSRSDV